MSKSLNCKVLNQEQLLNCKKYKTSIMFQEIVYWIQVQLLAVGLRWLKKYQRKEAFLQIRQQNKKLLPSISSSLMEEIEGVDFYQKDARNVLLHSYLLEKYGYFDTFISDMAPNFVGQKQSNHLQIVELNKMSLYLCGKLGKLQQQNVKTPEGDQANKKTIKRQKINLVMKSLPGRLQKSLFNLLCVCFQKIHRFKPQASRSQSSEFYYICLNRKMFFHSSEKYKKLLDLEIDEKMEKKHYNDIFQI